MAMPIASDRQSLGKLGETLACDELRRRGYSILATRHRTRFGEIDIVSMRDGRVAFVEVKARKSSRHGGAVEAVSAPKRRRIAAMALDYLAYTGRLDSPCSFVVVAIDHVGTPEMTLRVIEDAWTVD
jgi:putative endonuclease